MRSYNNDGYPAPTINSIVGPEASINWIEPACVVNTVSDLPAEPQVGDVFIITTMTTSNAEIMGSSMGSTTDMVISDNTSYPQIGSSRVIWTGDTWEHQSQPIQTGTAVYDPNTDNIQIFDGADWQQMGGFNDLILNDPHEGELQRKCMELIAEDDFFTEEVVTKIKEKFLQAKLDLQMEREEALVGE